jgi:enoyl-CoA hydratase
MGDLTTYSCEDGIARIAIDDGKVNAFSIAMLEALHAALDRAEADGAMLVLEGREGYFSAGFDLRVFQEEPERLPLMLRLGATLCERLLAFPAPVLAVCTGHAIAAGSFVLLSADACIGVEGPFKIGLNEVRIGLTVPLFVVELARARLAPHDFDRVLVSARMHSPEEALAARFLDRVVPAAQLADAVAAATADLASLNREAGAATKLRVRGAALEALRAAIDAELPE